MQKGGNNRVHRKIAVDIDDVIFEFMSSFADYHNRTHGTTATSANLVDYYRMDEHFGCDVPQLVRRIEDFISKVDPKKFPPIEGSVSALTALRADHDLYAVSSRSASLLEHSKNYLTYHLPGVFTEVIHTDQFAGIGPKQNKADICHKIGATLLIDDHAGHFEGLPEKGVTCVLFGDYAWNRHYPQGAFVRAKGWHEVEAG